MAREQRTGRLTVLIDPDKKAVFEHLCALDDVTASQVVRRLIREFIEQRTGRAWQPGQGPEHFSSRLPASPARAENKRSKTG